MRVDVVRLSHSGTPRPPAGLPTLLLACLQTLETKGGEPRPGEARAEPLGGRGGKAGAGSGSYPQCGSSDSTLRGVHGCGGRSERWGCMGKDGRGANEDSHLGVT